MRKKNPFQTIGKFYQPLTDMQILNEKEIKEFENQKKKKKKIIHPRTKSPANNDRSSRFCGVRDAEAHFHVE